MNTKEFLTENREEVVNYYNNNVKDFYKASMKDFMLDLLNNFRKMTITEGFSKTDLMGNLKEAQSRLGMFDVKIGLSYSKPYAESKHAKAVALYGIEKVRLMYN